MSMTEVAGLKFFLLRINGASTLNELDPSIEIELHKRFLVILDLSVDLLETYA